MLRIHKEDDNKDKSDSLKKRLKKKKKIRHVFV